TGLHLGQQGQVTRKNADLTLHGGDDHRVDGVGINAGFGGDDFESEGHGFESFSFLFLFPLSRAFGGRKRKRKRKEEQIALLTSCRRRRGLRRCRPSCRSHLRRRGRARRRGSS